MKRDFYSVINELCQEMNIKLEKLSFGWILKLSKDGENRYIIENRFDINPEAAGKIACDKYATYEVLKSQNVPVIEHKIIFNPPKRKRYMDYKEVWETVKNELSEDEYVVVKPNYGSEGIGVYLCHNFNEVKKSIETLFGMQNSISLCPYYNIKKEYRVFYLDGKVYLIYGKTKPYVIGNGKDTLGELIKKLNLPSKSVVKENLKLLNLKYIPKENEKIEISWKHNLSGGAEPEVLEPGKLYDEIKALAIKAGKAMNIKFATIDIIETKKGELYVLEINSGIGSSILINKIEQTYEIIKSMYRDAINKLFE